MTDQDEWTLGQTSQQFESGGNGPGTVSTGEGDPGGISYGTYQMASKRGVVQEYLKGSAYRDSFKDMEVNSTEFIAEWKRLAREDPGFAQDQHAFVQKNYYDPSFNSLKKKGIDLDLRGDAFKDMVWSTSVQYGPGATVTKIVDRGLSEAYGKDYVIGGLSDSQVVQAVQESKLRHVATDFAHAQWNSPSLETRIQVEKFALTHLAEHGAPLSAHELSSYRKLVEPIKPGAHGDRVTDLQQGLADLGYMDRSGISPDRDGHFGRGTEEALKSFQHASGLVPHGLASPLTILSIQEQLVARKAGLENIRSGAEAAAVCRLDDPSHPDHSMYSATRILVHDLDRSHGRVPDERSDNLAASLVISARQSGLERVDQVALSDDASRLWGVQRPPGIRDHFFDRQASVETMQGLNTPLIESSNRWPEAMHAYESVRQDQQQSQEQTKSQATPILHVGPTQ